MNCPTELHMNDVKRVHRYLKGTVDLGDRKSTFEYVFMMY